MKKIFIFISVGLALSSCSSELHDQAEDLMTALAHVKSTQEEQEVLNEIWNLAYEEREVNLSASAIDAEGNSVITSLSGSIEPVEVTVTLSADLWHERRTFTPLDLNNVYILLNE